MQMVTAAIKLKDSCSSQNWPRGWKRSVFIPIPKKGNVKECSNYRTIALISHASRVMLKLLQARLQQHVNGELPDFQAGFRKGRGTRDQIANIHWIIEKAREFQKNICLCFIDYAKAFNCVDHKKMWEILKEMGIPDHLTFLLRNLYAGQEATVRTGHGTTDWFQTGKTVCQGCILSPCLFNLYAEYIMRNAGLEKHKLESRLPGEISITSDMQMTPPLWWRRTKEPLDESERGEWKRWLKANTLKTKIMASGPSTSWQIDGETAADFIFGGSKITADGNCSHEIKRLWQESYDQPTQHIKNQRQSITLSTKVHLVKAMVFPVVM